MNSFFNKNYSLFEQRFPQFAKILPKEKAFEFANQGIEQCTILNAKNGELTAKFKDKALHSVYNPIKEAENIAVNFESSNRNRKDSQNLNIKNVFFLGYGLGYGAIEFAKKFPQLNIIIVESDFPFAFLPFITTDLSSLFSHKNLILLFGLSHEEIIGFMEKQKIIDYSVIKNPAQILHNELWFNQFVDLLQRNKEKQKINENTKKKYGKLWENNAKKNFSISKKLPGIIELKNIYENTPAFIVCAGPTLENSLQNIKEIQKKCILICVDTALHKLLKLGIFPDFTVVMDSQYWNSRHLDFLNTENTTLISEISVYPSVFRKKWKKIYLCNSFFPVGKKLEKNIERGTLTAGGSVATSCWDFARYLGCKNIFMAGLDLGFPKNQTHTKGSTFETWAEQKSGRLKTLDFHSSCARFNAKPVYSKSYDGEIMQTDNRMKMYAWWFESKLAEFPQIKTYCLSKKSLAIPGMKIAEPAELLQLPDFR